MAIKVPYAIESTLACYYCVLNGRATYIVVFLALQAAAVAVISQYRPAGQLQHHCLYKSIFMNQVLYNRQHLKEYILYGFLAAVAFTIPTSFLFFNLSYHSLFITFLGSVLFMGVILAYIIRLVHRKPDYRSTWNLIVAAHLSVICGILFSILFMVILCFIFIPGFLSGHSTNTLADAPLWLNKHNWGFLGYLFVCATGQNFGAGSFISILGPYVFKKNQTTDETAVL